MSISRKLQVTLFKLTYSLFSVSSYLRFSYNASNQDHMDPWWVLRLDSSLPVSLLGPKYYKQESILSRSADLLARLCTLYVFQNVDQTCTPSFLDRSSSVTAGSTCFYFLPLRRRFAGPSFQNTQAGKRCNILDPSSQYTLLLLGDHGFRPQTGLQSQA